MLAFSVRRKANARMKCFCYYAEMETNETSSHMVLTEVVKAMQPLSSIMEQCIHLE